TGINSEAINIATHSAIDRTAPQAATGLLPAYSTAETILRILLNVGSSEDIAGSRPNDYPPQFDWINRWDRIIFPRINRRFHGEDGLQPAHLVPDRCRRAQFHQGGGED